MQDSHDTPLQFSLKEIIKARAPRRVRRWLSAPVVSVLEKIICQDELNAILRYAHPARGVEFARKALEYLHIDIKAQGLENIPENGRFIFASNHPLGGLDGIALIALLGEKYKVQGIKFPVNDLLLNVKPLAEVFIPINKFSRQGRKNAAMLERAMASDVQMLYFPAGLVSRLGDDGKVKDLTWQKTFVQKALEHDRIIIPVHFSGLNSRLFYRGARLRRRLGLKFNLEQILLPREMIRQKGANYTVSFGKPITPAQLREMGAAPAKIASQIKEISYSL